MDIKKVLIARNGRKFYVKDLNQDMHTQYGFVSKEELGKAKDGELLKSNTGKEFFVFEPAFIDLYRKIKRDAQIIPLKDIGQIITETGMNKESKVLDCGSGSGACACFFASIAREVVTYEIREDFIEIVKKNIKFLQLENIKVERKNIYEERGDSNFDIINLDLPEPWKALKNCATSLKAGGFLVSYSPSVPQVSDFVNELRKNEDFVYIKTIELIEREWEVEERKVRPKSQGIGHSGFLSFARKVKN